MTKAGDPTGLGYRADPSSFARFFPEAAGIPMLAVLASRMPVEELARKLLGALF